MLVYAKYNTFSFAFLSLIPYFGFAESTSALQNKEKRVFLWFCARLSVPLASPKVLALDK